jgi:pantothenate synthetase
VRLGLTSYALLAVRVGNTRLIDNMLIHAGAELAVEV